MKQVTIYECSFCGTKFEEEEACLVHEGVMHHSVMLKYAEDIRKYCRIMRSPEMGSCEMCYFHPSKFEKEKKGCPSECKIDCNFATPGDWWLDRKEDTNEVPEEQGE